MISKQKTTGIITFLAAIFLLCLSLKSVGSFVSSPATVYLSSTSSVQTALEWYPSDSSKRKTDWYAATSYCSGLPTASGLYQNISWRLPTIDELQYKYNESGSAGFTNNAYWSLTGSVSGSAYNFWMPTDNVLDGSWLEDKRAVGFVRCMRDNEWYESDSLATDWYTASLTCAGLDKSGGLNPGLSWRLPTIEELESKYNESSSTPPGFTNDVYWSLTGSTSGSAYNFWMSTDNGLDRSWLGDKRATWSVRCARSSND